jgi:hypothetical protein
MDGKGMRLRQVALVVRELEPAVGDFERLLGLEVAHRDPGVAVFGLVNAVLPVGDGFLELVSPAGPDTSAGRLLERRGGDGGYMAIFQPDDLAAGRRRAAAAGVRVVWEAALEGAATLHLHPRDLGGAIVSLDWMDPPDSWRWAGPRWREHVRTGVVDAITGVEVQGPDPAALADRWGRVLDRPPEPAGRREWRIALDAGAVHFGPDRDGRGEGLSGIRVRARDPERLLATAREQGLGVEAGAIAIRGIRLTPG